MGVGLIATMSFCVTCSLSNWSFPTVSDKFVAVCLMLAVVSSGLVMIEKRVPLVPSRCSWMDVKISVTNVLPVRSVKRIEIEHMDSSSVLGIFCASAMCSSAVVRLLYVIDCCVRMRFLVRRKSRPSAGIWTDTLSGLLC